MVTRIVLWCAVMAAALAAQNGTPPKKTEQEYPAHANLRRMAIGAEYLVHSFSSGREMFIAKDYLVVEVALFPPAGETFRSSVSQLSLRINGRGNPIVAHSPEIVAATLRDRENSSGMHPSAQLGPVVFAPRPTGRFPGDPNAPNSPPSTAPTPTNPTVKDTALPVTPEELAVQAALPEGEHKGPISGFVYFPYKGKLSRIRSLELIFSGSEGDSTLPLPLL